MGWFSNLFSPAASNVNARKKMAMSTHDAFSLPTSSPITASHPDAFARSGANTPDIESQLNPSYSYPPPMSSPTTYDYVPRVNGRGPSSNSRQSSLLPTHSTAPLSPLPPYPALEQTWGRIRNWLSREYPELGDTLNYGILPQDLGEIEMALGMQLPQAVRESYLIVDGQEAESSAGCSEGLFFGLTFLPLEDVLEEWRFWREVDDDPSTGGNPRLRELMQSIPPRWVRRAYSQRGWIPLVTDKAGNYLGVDLNPDEHGSVGQVIVFGRDFDSKIVMWRGDGPAGWARWLASFAEELESGEGFELGHVSDESEGSEDSVGYESYFYDGSGRTKGDGGGDSGAGLRMTGEYRGWSVLEAWADKSVKKWRENGQLPDQPVSPELTNKGSAKVGLGMLDVGAGRSNGAEVPIPIVRSAEEDSKTPTRSTTNAIHSASGNGQPLLPTISVTKAPAPRPLELPSPRDLRSPSPIDSRSTSFDQDLERGRESSMDEVEHPLSSPAVPVKSQPPTSPVAKRSNETISPIKEATLVSLPPSSDDLTPTSEKPSPAVADLLQQNEASQGVPITPIQPETSPIVKKLDMQDSLIDTVSAPSTSQTTLGETEAVSHEDTQDPDQTIRLIGGGGIAGLVSDAEPVPEAEHDLDLAEVASVTSVTSTDAETASISSKKSKHEKKKSFSAGLKKIGKLGSGSAKRNSKSDSKGKNGTP